MYNKEIIEQLVEFISDKDGNTDKSHLQNAVQEAFDLVKERSVYYCDWFAIRFCKSASRSFGNTVLALSALHKYDDIPFIVCLVTPTRNYLMLANTTFLRKISHSSQELRRDNIKGSFNGSDIMREFEGVENITETVARGEHLIVISPHFVGLDAAGIGLNLHVRGCSLYQKQANPVWDEAALKGRLRFADPELIAKRIITDYIGQM